MVGVLAIQTSSAVRGGIDASRKSMDERHRQPREFSSGVACWQFGFGRSQEDEAKIAELRGARPRPAALEGPRRDDGAPDGAL